MNMMILFEKLLVQVFKEARISCYNADSVRFLAQRNNKILVEIDSAEGFDVNDRRNFGRDVERLQKTFVYLQAQKLREARMIQQNYEYHAKRAQYEYAYYGSTVVDLVYLQLQINDWMSNNGLFVTTNIIFEQIGVNPTKNRYILRVSF